MEGYRNNQITTKTALVEIVSLSINVQPQEINSQ